MNLGAALVALLIAWVIKIAVMWLGARLILRLYRSAFAAPVKRPWLLLPQSDLPEVKLLFWGLVCFFASELSCGIEIYVILRSSPITSIFHSLVSSLGMALFAVGLWRHLDRKLFHYGGQGCLLNRLCKGCTIEEPAGCKYRTLLLMGASFVVLAALPPFLASTDQMVADPRRWMLPFPALNGWYDGAFIPWLKGILPALDPTGGAYYIFRSVNWVEFRLLPGAGLVLAIAGTILIHRGREARGLELVLAGLGVLGYVYLELVTFRLHGDALAGGVMHEVAELWFLLFCAELLARSYGTTALEARPLPPGEPNRPSLV